MTLENVIIHQQDHETLPHHMTCTESWWNLESGQLLKYKINVYPQRDLKGDKNGEGPSNQVLMCVAVLPFPGSTQAKVTLLCLAVASCLMRKVRWKITAVLNIRSSRKILLRPIHHHRDTRGYCVLCALHSGCVWTPWSSSTCFVTHAWLVWVCFLRNLTYGMDAPTEMVFQWIPVWWGYPSLSLQLLHWKGHGQTQIPLSSPPHPNTHKHALPSNQTVTTKWWVGWLPSNSMFECDFFFFFWSCDEQRSPFSQWGSLASANNKKYA